jgi:acetylglutamate kinase
MSGPLVIKIGGAGVDEPRRNRALWEAVAESFAALDGRLILVHGGGRAVDAHLSRLGFAIERVAGLRVTPEAQIEEIVAVLAGRVNKAIVAAVQSVTGVRAAGLSLSDGGIAVARRISGPKGEDLGRVGEIVPRANRDDDLLALLMSRRILPVLCSIANDAEGQPLNINADDAAAGIAAAVQARGLVLLTDVAGILDGEGKLLARASPAAIARLIEQGVIHGGMIPKAKAAVTAATCSGVPATIASWSAPSDLVRIARGEAAGTTVQPG